MNRDIPITFHTMEDELAVLTLHLGPRTRIRKSAAKSAGHLGILQ